LVEDRTSCADFEGVLLFIDGSVVISEVNISEVVVEAEERLLDGVFNSFSLFVDRLIEVLSLLSELVEDDDSVIDVNFGFFLQLLHSCGNLSGESSYLKLFVLADVQQNAE
jgi:hypothetical protein